jgi:hypothetical protein
VAQIQTLRTRCLRFSPTRCRSEPKSRGHASGTGPSYLDGASSAGDHELLLSHLEQYPNAVSERTESAGFPRVLGAFADTLKRRLRT